MEEDTTRQVISAAWKAFCCEACIRAGPPPDEVETAAELLAKSDLRGVETHDVTHLPIHIKRL